MMTLSVRDGRDENNMKNRNKKPVIHLLHHMARSGGTIISRCLGCMKDIVLLSEIHPLGYELQYINPLAQAHEWFNLLEPEDLARVQFNQPISFVEAIELIKRRCDERGLTLVIRDWSHMDFTGWPHNNKPSYKLTTARVLASRFTIIKTATVRHPIDQWLSFSESQSWTGTEFSLGNYLKGYRKFAEAAAKMGYERYEDFADNPKMILEKLCKKLRINYDAQFEDNCNSYQSITTATRDRDGGFSISKRPRRPVEDELIESFAGNKDYKAAIKILGYKHPI
jgi:hypothetical protein